MSAVTMRDAVNEHFFQRTDHQRQERKKAISFWYNKQFHELCGSCGLKALASLCGSQLGVHLVFEKLNALFKVDGEGDGDV